MTEPFYVKTPRAPNGSDVVASVTDEGELLILSGYATPADALRLAAWLVEAFGEGRGG